MDAHTISHFDLHTQTEKMASQFLPLTGKPRILITSGASCPDAVVEKVILKLISFYQETKPMGVLIKQFE